VALDLQAESDRIAKAGGNHTPGILINGVSLPEPSIAHVRAALDHSSFPMPRLP